MQAPIRVKGVCVFGFGRLTRQRTTAAKVKAYRERYVDKVLCEIKHYSRRSAVVGQSFTYRIVDVPQDVATTQEIVLGVIEKAASYNLHVEGVFNERLYFKRID